MKKHDESDNRKLFSILVMLCIFFVLFVVFLMNLFFKSSEINPMSTTERKVIYQNRNPINLSEIIQANANEDIREEMVVEEIDMEYTTRYKNNSDLPDGVVQVLKEGRVGRKNAVIIKKYQNDELISEELVAENIIKAPAERVVETGTGSKYRRYEAQVGDDIFVVSESVAVKLAPDVNAEKIFTLNKDEKAKILQIDEDWYYIAAEGIKGYIPSNCVTTNNPNLPLEEQKEPEYSREQLLANLSYDMDLRKPSDFSLDQFKQVFANDANDKNGIFASNAEYFYYIEKQYGINGIFVASVGIHESGWGTSTIARNKNNLFGYGAVDSNPYGGANAFASYAEGIDLLARVFVKYYLNAPGTIIYDGTAATGKFYSGSTLSAVNSKYASDRNWSNGVFKWMDYLYHKL